jgi:2-haloacid dehalogenase
MRKDKDSAAIVSLAPPGQMKPRAFVFDAYGTLFDVHSVVLRDGNNIPGGLQALSSLWRQKQLEYTWLRSLMERYEDFWDVTEAALRSAVRQLKIEASDVQLDTLMQAYLFPSAFPDVRPALKALKGALLAILSNGSPRMLESAVRHNGLDSYFAEIISADRVKTYKPSPRVYALATEILNLPASNILFISSNSWDAAGAKAFGYKVCGCYRSTTEMEYFGCAPDLMVTRLDQIAHRSGILNVRNDI